MSGFEPCTSGIGSNHSANWATTTAHDHPLLGILFNLTYRNTTVFWDVKVSSEQIHFNFKEADQSKIKERNEIRQIDKWWWSAFVEFDLPTFTKSLIYKYS